MWEAFCEHLRECGRSGNLFVLIMLLVFAGAIFGVAGITVLLGLLAAYLIWFCIEIGRMRERYDKLGRQPPLASVDLRVARSKLAKSQTQRLMTRQPQRPKTQRLSAASAASPLRLRVR